jgi:hypothetical protein
VENTANYGKKTDPPLTMVKKQTRPYFIGHQTIVLDAFPRSLVLEDK